MHIFDELKERGLVFQTTDEEALRKALEEGQVWNTADVANLLDQFFCLWNLDVAKEARRITNPNPCAK